MPGILPTDLRALVVEDDHSWQEILVEILNDAGLQVDVVSSLNDALEIIRIQAHRIAIVDLSLGGSDHHNQDGLQVMHELRLRDPGCASILLTGFATVELAVSALTEHGAFTCLRKETFKRAQFRELVKRAMAAPPIGVASSAAQPHPDLVDSAADSFFGLDQTVSDVEKPRKDRILIVEDDAGWRSILNEILADADFEVHQCSSFGEALGWLRREKFNAAVIDLSLANSLPMANLWNQEHSGASLDGYRLLASTRAASIPTIVVSGVAMATDIEQAYAEHAIFAYIQKQAFNRQAFLKTVEDAIASPGLYGELSILTDRERDVLRAMGEGKTNKEIAETLFISTNTVKRHIKAIFEKLDIHTRSAAAAKAASLGGSVDRSDRE